MSLMPVFPLILATHRQRPVAAQTPPGAAYQNASLRTVSQMALKATEPAYKKSCKKYSLAVNIYETSRPATVINWPRSDDKDLSVNRLTAVNFWPPEKVPRCRTIFPRIFGRHYGRRKQQPTMRVCFIPTLPDTAAKCYRRAFAMPDDALTPM